MTKEIFLKNHYYSPLFILKRFQSMLEYCGEDVVFRSTKFQKEREAWITALFLIPLSNSEHKPFWLGVEEIEQTPDTYGVSLRKMEKGQSLDIFNIEIVEWEEHSKNGLVEHIMSKLENKNYPTYFTLLCYVHGHAGEKVELEDVYQQIVSKGYKLGAVFLLASQVHAVYDHRLAKLHPGRFSVDFKLTDEIEKLPIQADIIKTNRGLGTEMEFLGQKKLEFPKCHLW